MPTYVYRPKHPMADEFGHVEKSLALEWDYLNSPDNRAIVSNRIININYISDIMPETRHMVDGKHYTSKSAFRQATKQAGCIEVGNDSSYLSPKPKKFITPSKKQRREDIKKAVYELKNNKRV